MLMQMNHNFGESRMEVVKKMHQLSMLGSAKTQKYNSAYEVA